MRSIFAPVIRPAMTAVALSLFLCAPAMAQHSGHGGGHGGGGHIAGGGHWNGGGHRGHDGHWGGGHWWGGWGVGIGLGAYGWWPGYWGPYYYDDYYYAPPYLSGTTVIEQAPAMQSIPAPAVASYYYCTNPKGYYPTVMNCLVPWQPVPVVPQGVAQP